MALNTDSRLPLRQSAAMGMIEEKRPEGTVNESCGQVFTIFAFHKFLFIFPVSGFIALVQTHF
jgi:hypothetical protein